MKSLIFMLVLCKLSTAQFANKPLREDFDYIFNSSAYTGIKGSNSTFSLYKFEPSFFFNGANNCSRRELLNQLGDGNSYLLLALLNMFEVTLDKDYLIKFIQQANRILMFRRDIIQGISSELYEPRWDFDDLDENGPCFAPNQMYHDGLLLNPYARFVYIVRVKYPNLINTPLPTSTIEGISSVPHAGGVTPVSTYGEVATHYKIQTEISLDWFINKGYWGDQFRTFLPTPDNGREKSRPQVVNQIVGFANTLYYLGAVGNASYTAKAEIIALHYLSYPVDEDGRITDMIVRGTSDLKCGFSTSCGRKTIESVFQTKDDHFIWYSGGWRSQDCNECKGQLGTEQGPDDYEDVSHAGLTTAFPATHADENFIQSGVSDFFNNDFYSKLHNTLTKSICVGSENGRLIVHAGVDGNDDITYNASLQGVNNPGMRKALLGWSWLYPWDSPGERKVYDICMVLYGEMENDKLLSDNSLRDNTTSIKGLSQLTRAQWDKECTNNTLFNRNLTYNQDFFAKNNLTIDPEKDTYDAFNITRIGQGVTKCGDASYNEPIIYTPTFEIARDVICNMTAGEQIVLKTGFHAVGGSIFTARNTPSSCTNGQRPAVNDELVTGVQPENTKLDRGAVASKEFTKTPSHSNVENSLSVVPNPFKDATDLVFHLQTSGSVTITIRNNLGQVVYNQLQQKELEAGKQVIPVSTENFSQGMYHCLMTVDNQQIMTAVLVKQ